MKKHLNNKGYMLVEIVLASVIAMAIAYFITDLTIKLKNKNDDLLVMTEAATDQAIIYNRLMKEIYNDPNSFDCDKLHVYTNIFKYDNFINIMSNYLSINGTVQCSKDSSTISIQIPLKVKQLKDEFFDININYDIKS